MPQQWLLRSCTAQAGDGGHEGQGAAGVGLEPQVAGLVVGGAQVEWLPGRVVSGVLVDQVADVHGLVADRPEPDGGGSK